MPTNSVALPAYEITRQCSQTNPSCMDLLKCYRSKRHKFEYIFSLIRFSRASLGAELETTASPRTVRRPTTTLANPGPRSGSCPPGETAPPRRACSRATSATRCSASRVLSQGTSTNTPVSGRCVSFHFRQTFTEAIAEKSFREFRRCYLVSEKHYFQRNDLW